MKGKRALLLGLAGVLALSVAGCSVFKDIGWGVKDLVTGPPDKFTLGLRHQEVGRYQEAMSAFNAFTKASPKDDLVPWAKLHVGQCLEGLGEKELAHDSYKRLIAEYPGTEAAKFAKDFMKTPVPPAKPKAKAPAKPKAKAPAKKGKKAAPK